MSGGNRRSFMYKIKHRAKKGIIISRNINQGESQKIDFILPVLDYLLNHTEFYATELKRQFAKINHKSIDRTILLLQKKNLITLKTIELKNKKIFKVKSNIQLKKYRNELYKYKKFKIISNAAIQTKQIHTFNDLEKLFYRFDIITGKSIKKNKFHQLMPVFLTNIPLKIKNKSPYQKLTNKKNYSKPIPISQMSHSKATKIIKDYGIGNICKICFKEGKLQYLVKNYEESVCDYGHITILDEYDTESYSHTEILDPKKTAKKLTDKGFAIEKRRYIRKNINSQTYD